MTSSGPPKRIAWIALCLVIPLASGTVPGTYRAEAAEGCDQVPCALWESNHKGPEDKAMAHHLVLSPDGSTVYVVGSIYTIQTSTDLMTWAIDVATGDLLWSTFYHGRSSEQELGYHDVSAVSVSPDGSRVVVAGSSHGGFGMGHDIVTIVYDAATGQELWMDRYHGGPDSRDDDATAIVVDRTGTFVVTAGGTDERDGGRQGILIGHDLATGTRLWEVPFSSDCFLADVLGMKSTSASPAIFVGGLRSSCLSDGIETPQDASHAFTPTIWAVDPATGQVLWETQDDDPLITLQSAVLLGALEVTEESVVLASRITNPRNVNADLDVLTMSVDLQGEIQWRARYDSMGRDDLLGLRAAPDGSRVYVIATSPALATTGISDQNRDIVVTAYDRQGQVAWTSRLDSSATGLELRGAMIGGEGSDNGVLAEAALLESGTRLAFGYTAWFESPVPFVGPAGPNAHVVVVLDTEDGTVAYRRLDDAALRQYSFAAVHDRADFVGVGSYGRGSDSYATFRRLSLDVTPPDLHVPAALALEATGPAGAMATFNVTATDDRDGDVAVACSVPSGTMFPLGSTRVHCTAQDSYGNVVSGSFDVHVQDKTAPALRVPDDLHAAATSASGSAVHFEVSAHDLVDGEVATSCSHASGQTFAPGATTVSCRADDGRGNRAIATFDVVVTFDWTGFQDPVGADVSSEFHRGRTVPVKVQLAGDSAGITDATFRLWVQTGGVEVPAIGRTSTSNQLRYDAEGELYSFAWDTSTVLPGQHVLRLELGDGTQNLVTVRVA